MSQKPRKHVLSGLVCISMVETSSVNRLNYCDSNPLSAFKMRTWVSNFIPYQTLDVITYPCPNIRKHMLSGLVCISMARPTVNWLSYCDSNPLTSFHRFDSVHFPPMWYIQVWSCIWVAVDYTSQWWSWRSGNDAQRGNNLVLSCYALISILNQPQCVMYISYFLGKYVWHKMERVNPCSAETGIYREN